MPLNPDSIRRTRAAADPSAAVGSLQLSGRKLLLAMTGVMRPCFWLP